MIVEQSTSTRDAQIIAAIRSVVTAQLDRVHAEIDALADDMVTDVMVALLAPELIEHRS